MVLIVKFVLFINLFKDVLMYQSTTTAPLDVFNFGHHSDGLCWLLDTTFEATETLIRKANCKHLHLTNVNVTKSSQKLMANITNGLEALTVTNSSVDSFYLPHNMIYFEFIGIPGCSTQIVIEENVKYKTKTFALVDVPQLPVNINKLRKLEKFVCFKVYAANLDFTIFSEMSLLQDIKLSDIKSVTFLGLVHLPNLQWLTIFDTQVTFSNATLEFPTVFNLRLHNNSLQEIPNPINSFTSLKYLSLCSNKLRRLTLDVFANMSQLKMLDLTDNQISEIFTENQVILPHLKELSLASNKLTSLNVTLWVMPALEFFSIDNNQLYRVEGLLELFTDNLLEFVWRVNNTQTFIPKNFDGCPSN